VIVYFLVDQTLGVSVSRPAPRLFAGVVIAMWPLVGSKGDGCIVLLFFMSFFSTTLIIYYYLFKTPSPNIPGFVVSIICAYILSSSAQLPAAQSRFYLRALSAVDNRTCALGSKRGGAVGGG
jgi:hypothetical protein